MIRPADRLKGDTMSFSGSLLWARFRAMGLVGLALALYPEIKVEAKRLVQPA